MEAARLYAVVTANTKGLAAGMGAADGMVRGFAGRAQGRLGKFAGFVGKWSKRVALGVVAVGAASGVLAMGFEDSMTDIRALVGASDKQMAMYEKNVLGMAKTLPQGPKALADALYFVTSSGFEGAAAMRVLEASAKAGAAGLGDVSMVADAVTSAVNAYGEETLTASRATDILLAAVREGKSEPEELAKTIGKVISPAQTMGVTFEEVAGILASMSMVGIDAATGTTALRGALMGILKPSRETVKFLGEAGESIASIRKEIADKGLLPTMTRLAEKFEGNQDAIGKLFPNVRALNAFLALTGKNSDKTATAVAGVANSVGDTEEAFAKAMENSRKRMQTAWSSIQANLIMLGGSVGPVFATIVEHVAGAVDRVSGFIGRVREANGMKARVGIVVSGIKDFAGDVWQTLRDGLMGASTKPLKLKSGKILEVEPPTEGFLSKWQRGLSSAFDSVNWSNVGKSIVDGITAALRTGSQIAAALASMIGGAITGVDWVGAGKKMGPFLIAMLASAFITLLDPGFWISNWELLLGVALAAIGLVFAPARFAFLGTRIIAGLAVAFGKAAVWIAKGVWTFIGAPLLRGLISKVAPNAAKGAALVVARITGTLKALPGLAGAYIQQLARIAGEKLGQLVVLGGRLALQFVNRLLNPFRTIGSKVGGLLGQAVSRVAGFVGHFAATGARLGRALIDAIVGAIRSAAGAIKGAVGGIVRSIPGIGGKVAGFLGLAKGGVARRSTPYIVGEKGPELFVPGRTGRVHSASDTADILGKTGRLLSSTPAMPAPVLAMGGGGDVVWTGDLVVQGSVVTENDLIDTVQRGLQEKSRRNRP